MPRHDDNEPQRRRQQDGENRPQRPTQDRPQTPRFDIPQQGPEHLPAAPNDRAPQPQRREQEPTRAPELGRATGDETRRATGNANIPGDMRDMLNRLNRIDQPGDISDAEARRLAGLDDETGEPRPTEANIVPAVTRHEVANISQAIQAAGQVYPKWHGIKNLPGFQNRQIRGMGQDLFSMFTTTPHHDILTISTMANSEREVKAVLAWLQQNAEELPELDIDYSGYGMPGYQPNVREFKTDNTRFHVVQDRAGWYIYAYPEGTAVEHAGKNQIGHDNDTSGEDERDEFGALIPKKLKESKNMKQFSTISEQIRHLTNKLDLLQESALMDELTESVMETVMLEASSLMDLLGKNTNGAYALMKAVHSRHKLGAGKRGGQAGLKAGWDVDPQYEEIDAKNIARAIKASRDNFAIIVGSEGVAAVKPFEEDWLRARNPTHDNTMRYVVIWATGDTADQEVHKYRMGRTDATGGSEGTTGTPNLLQVLQDRIGRTTRLFIAKEAVGRPKQEFRNKDKMPAKPMQGGSIGMPQQDAEGNWGMKGTPGTPAPDIATVAAKKMRPLASRLFQGTLGQLGPRIQRLAQGGNYDAVQKLTQAGKRLQAMATALDAPNPDWDTWNSPLKTFVTATNSSIQELTSGMDSEAKNRFTQSLVNGEAQALGQLLNTVRTKLFSISE